MNEQTVASKRSKCLSRCHVHVCDARQRHRALADILVAFAWLSWQEALANHYIANDWRRANDADLQRRILTETPLGSSMSQVEEVIQREGWDRVRVDHERGFLGQRERGTRTGFLPTVGAMHIEANAGDFVGMPFQSNVTIFWGFDQDGKLIDVWAWRTIDAM